MPAATPTRRDCATSLTRCALRLLEISFEPACPLSGECFDRVVEGLSEQLSDAAGAELAGCPAPSFVPPRLEPQPPTVTRRAQAGLRRHIESGRLPGNGGSLRRACDDVDVVRAELGALLAEIDGPLHSRELVTAVRDALERLSHVLTTYRHGYARLAPLVTKGDHSTDVVGDSATRLERYLLRCLDRVGDSRVLR